MRCVPMSNVGLSSYAAFFHLYWRTSLSRALVVLFSVIAGYILF